jgi:predicted metalloprotease
MKWRDRQQSTNVDDRRHTSGPAQARGGGPSIATVLMLWPVIKPLLRSKLGLAILGIGAIAYFAGSNLLPHVTGIGGSGGIDEAQDEEWAAFIKTVHADTEAVWSRIFAQSGHRYPPPTLVLYRGSTVSACGPASARMGPFYCPEDQQIYVDLGFFDDLARQHGAEGDFARAYVLAHEVGHHIQNLEGTLADVQRAKQQVRGEAQENDLQVRVELQADCYAGVWANHAHQLFNMLEEGDLEEALTAASAIGDDRLQKQARGFAIPHTFTHGTSKQRAGWFARGFKSGEISACQTFDGG